MRRKARQTRIRAGEKDVAALEVFKSTVQTWDHLRGEWGFREDRLYGGLTLTFSMGMKLEQSVPLS